MSAPVRADRLAELLALAEAGAPMLSLKLVAAEQPDPTVVPEQWMHWERARIQLLASTEDWGTLEKRLAVLPDGLPAEFGQWAGEQRALALLALGQPDSARRVLRALLWQSEAAADRIEFWRRLVVRSYLEQGRADDAFAALVRYRQDYGDSSLEARLLAAKVMLRTARPRDAVGLLEGTDGQESRALTLLAELQADGATRAVLNRARTLQNESRSARERRLASGVMAVAAGVLGDHAAQVQALELHLSLPVDPAEPTSLAGDDLWQAYWNYAGGVGNREQMLLGDDEQWFQEVEAAGRMYPVRARSILALLAHHARDPQARLRAHEELMQRVLALPRGSSVLGGLYLSSAHFPSRDAIPAAVRWALIDSAIARGDLAVASQLVRNLDAVPEGIEPFTWELRRSKILLLGGEPARAAEVLHQIIPDLHAAPQEALDRLMQVVFDLQSLGEHETAVGLFQALLPMSQGQFRRELLYWMGESRNAQSLHIEAARLYLESAILDDPTAMDPWAQTARYQAARALAQAGLRADAVGLYRQLLTATDDPARRAVLQHDLEQLHLGDNADHD